MLIDWFTVAAQALNFLILVWLMKRFLYKPILLAIDAREKRVAAELADADAKRADARKERDLFREKNETFDRQRESLLSKATTEAKAERKRLLDEARAAADALSAKRRETLRKEALNLNETILRRTQQEVFAISRKVLEDLAETGLEDRLAQMFIRRLRELDGPAKSDLARVLKTTPGPAVLRSAVDLPDEQRTAIGKAIKESFSDDIQVRFETAPDLIGGIELVAGGQKVTWSIAGYLAAIEQGVADLVDTPAKPSPDRP